MLSTYLSWPSIWRDIVLTLVWIAPVASMCQTVIHLITAWVAGHQKSSTPVGPALAKRELSLGVKGSFRVIFDLLLLLAVTFGIDFQNDPLVAVILALFTVATVTALWYGFQYALILKREYEKTLRLEE